MPFASNTLLNTIGFEHYNNRVDRRSSISLDNHKMDPVAAHYNRVADKYDHVTSFEECYAAEHTGDMVDWLKLDKSDILADIGGGTGKWSKCILGRMKLDQDILLVDQNEPMVGTANQLTGISAVCLDFITFLKQDGLCFNKCLIRGCIHHVSDMEDFLTRLYAVSSLQRAVIVTRLEGMTTIPMFKKAYEATSEQNIDETNVVKLAREAGFEVHRFSKTYQVSIQRDFWLRCIENRVFSSIEHFSDEELAEGQKEICEQFPGDTVSFPDTWDAFVLTKDTGTFDK